MWPASMEENLVQYMAVQQIHFAVHLKLMQHYKSYYTPIKIFLKEETKESFVLSSKNGEVQVPNSCSTIYKFLLFEGSPWQGLFPGYSFEGRVQSFEHAGVALAHAPDLRGLPYAESQHSYSAAILEMPAQLFFRSSIRCKSSAGPLYASETK